MQRPDDDLAACRALMATGSKTFSAAAELLPRRVHAPATALYAFCRVADDAIDDPPETTAEMVAVLRDRLDRIFAGTPDEDPVDRALADVVMAYRLPRAPLDALLEGFAWDADSRRYETLDNLYAYATRVAGSVGVAMTVIMGSRAPLVLARACDLGVAMQLTNIARDVGEDARRGRLYLPLAWLREAGIDPDEWLVDPRFDARLAVVVRRLLDTAAGLYVRSEDGIAALPADCRRAIYAARLIYADIGREVARAGYDSVSSRAHVSTARKVVLVARALIAAPRRAAILEPPLGPARFLVAACSGGA